MVRSSRASRGTTLALIAALFATFGADVSAHREDEFLQAARLGVESDRVHVELSLTPGIAIADGAIREIDGNGDGVLSMLEQSRYAERVLSLIALHLDDVPLRLLLADSSFPNVDALRTGQAAIHLRLEAALPTLRVGAHRLFFRNGARENSVYLANALMPDNDRIVVTRQHRDFEQRELTVEFALRDTRLSRLSWVGLACALTLGQLLGRRRRVSCQTEHDSRFSTLRARRR